MENHLIIISMKIILENFNIDIIISKDLILFSLFQLKSEKICNMLKMAFGIIYNYLFITKRGGIPCCWKRDNSK